MFAIVATSGKQFRVSEGDRILVDRVAAGVGDTVRLDSILLLGGDDKPIIGKPFVEGAAVEATVVSHRAGDKVIVFKFESRKRKRRKLGHRQQLSELRIGAIRAPGDDGERGNGGPGGTGTSEPAVATAAGKPARKRGKAAATAEHHEPETTEA